MPYAGEPAPRGGEVPSILRHIAGSEWSTRRYLDIASLKEASHAEHDANDAPIRYQDDGRHSHSATIACGTGAWE